MNEAISVHDPRLLVESLIVLGRSHDGAVENDLRHAVTNIVAKTEADAKVILDLRTRLEDTVYPLGEIDGLMKVIAALRERMTQIRALVSTISESNWRDIGEHIARQAAEYEQTAGESK